MTTKFVYRFKLGATPEQERGLLRLAGARRFIFNWGLARRRAHYAEHGKTLRYPALNLELTTLRLVTSTTPLASAAAPQAGIGLLRLGAHRRAEGN